MRRLALENLAGLFGLPDFDTAAAQRVMEPAFRGEPPREATAEPPRTAAALAYVFEHAGEAVLPLTLRREDLPEHRGQVSLPGGRPQPDESPWDTACREAHEEIGLPPDLPRRLGALAPVYIPVTHTRLDVYVAMGRDPRPFQAQEQEVARIEVVALSRLLSDECRRTETWTLRGRRVRVPFFQLGDLKVWGATAMALSELAERLRATLHGTEPS